MSQTLDQLATAHFSTEGDQEEIERKWHALWQRSFEVPLAEVSLLEWSTLCNLGVSLAIQRRDWKSAEGRLQCFFEHPRHQEDREGRLLFRCQLAAVKLPLGREDDAINECRCLLANAQGRDRTLTLCILRNWFLGFVDAQDADALASESLKKFVLDLAAEFQGMHRRVRECGESPAQFSELAALLDRTYGRRPKRQCGPH